VGIFIFGIGNDTGNIMTYVTANNMTKAVAEAASVLDRALNAEKCTIPFQRFPRK